MELAALMASIRDLRAQRNDRFALNSLVQIGTADEDFRDPLAYAADPTGKAGELQVPELARRLGMTEELVTELRLVSDGPWDCALRSMLLEACGIANSA